MIHHCYLQVVYSLLGGRGPELERNVPHVTESPILVDAELKEIKLDTLLCGKSRRIISPGFGNTVSDYLCTLSVVSVYITDLVLQCMTDRADCLEAFNKMCD